jgi:hypothetical protein
MRGKACYQQQSWNPAVDKRKVLHEMKQLLIALVWLIALALSACTSKATAPSKPSLVPIAAVWAGGVDGGSFFECDVDTEQNVNRCLVYNDHTGDVEGGGFFQLSGVHRAARLDELKYRFFDGDRIYVHAGTLERVEPITPSGIPKGSVFTNGLFIHCVEVASGSTQCEVYRPDGSEYYKGSFVADTALGGKIQDGYKFFDLSDRTIHLVSGGALVSR